MPKKKIKRNLPLPFLFIALPALVVVIALFRFLSPKTDFVYAQVKVSQGLWWANTKSPEYWLIENLEKGMQEKNITNDPIAELLSFKYYPRLSQNLEDSSESTYNVYLKLKLNVNKSSSGAYTFKRSTLAVGAPIELDFLNVQITGSVMKLSEKPIEDNYETKVVELSGRNLFPWEYDSIKIGDAYFDGENEVFKVLNKTSRLTSTIAPDLFGNFPGSSTEQRRYVTVFAEIKLEKKADGRYFFGEEQEIGIGQGFKFMTPSANYSILTTSNIR